MPTQPVQGAHGTNPVANRTNHKVLSTAGWRDDSSRVQGATTDTLPRALAPHCRNGSAKLVVSRQFHRQIVDAQRYMSHESSDWPELTIFVVSSPASVIAAADLPLRSKVCFCPLSRDMFIHMGCDAWREGLDRALSALATSSHPERTHASVCPHGRGR